MWLQIDAPESPYFCSLFQQNHRQKSNFLVPPFHLELVQLKLKLCNYSNSLTALTAPPMEQSVSSSTIISTT